MRRLILLMMLLFLAITIALPGLIVQFPWQRSRVEIKDLGQNIRVFIHETGTIREMPIEEYLVGVVAAEMPVIFDNEALKAQAVAARTYTLKRLQQPGSNRYHQDADICTDPNHAQAWVSDTGMRAKWGWIHYFSNKKKIRTAVSETAGMVMTYNGKLIDPVYHSSCGGQTENSEEVWQAKIPYLRSVKCPEEPNKYTALQTLLPKSAVIEKLGLTGSAQAVFAGRNKTVFTVAQRSSTGRVKTFRVGEKEMAATEFRYLLGLPSAMVTWEVQGDDILFSSRGYGHGVGLCQYGADAMGRMGKTWQEILTHYYTGVKIVRIEQ